MNSKLVRKHHFVFNKNDNGGEQLYLTTNIFTNGDIVYSNQILTLNSYLNSASFNLVGAGLTPELLRQLADELEKEKTIAEQMAKNEKPDLMNRLVNDLEQQSARKFIQTYRDAPAMGPVIVDKFTAGDIYKVCEILLLAKENSTR